MSKGLLRMIARCIVWMLVREVRARLGADPPAEEVKMVICDACGVNPPAKRGRKKAVDRQLGIPGLVVPTPPALVGEVVGGKGGGGEKEAAVEVPEEPGGDA